MRDWLTNEAFSNCLDDFRKDGSGERLMKDDHADLLTKVKALEKIIKERDYREGASAKIQLEILEDKARRIADLKKRLDIAYSERDRLKIALEYYARTAISARAVAALQGESGESDLEKVCKAWLLELPWDGTACLALMALCKQMQVKGLREAAAVVCDKCRDGYPLQKNGGWHNDRCGHDTLVNGCCQAAVILTKVRELEAESATIEPKEK